MYYNPESNYALSLGCGYGEYAGYYTFITTNGGIESTTQARFTFIYIYIPTSFVESFVVESGINYNTKYTQTNNAGWYIDVQQSSILPFGH